ncbi:MAG: hypothetical protein K6E98_06435 [Lachnospiraceae bacterium]|nr:hypothetical protein [Lachnospiraceae bacterium]
MYIVNLLLILVIALILADYLQKEIEDVIPVAVFSLLLMLYVIAILGKAHHSYEASLIVFVLIVLFYVIKKKRLFPDKIRLKEILIKPGFLFYLLVLTIMFIAYSNHFITVWDDFHYNATFPKDMYYYGTMPTGSHSATLYRSYLPLMQLFFYWGFLGQGGFDEPLMFRYKMFLIYTCILPLFKQLNYKNGPVKNVFLGLSAFGLPFLFMYELLESLSMDTLMACLFGYALIHIICVDRKDKFCHLKILLSLSCLTLIKQIAFIFTCIALGTWAVIGIGEYIYCKKKGYKKTSGPLMWFVDAGISTGFYLSWKIFCNLKGNSVYLSGKLSQSISGRGIDFPEYANSTVRDFINDLFSYHLSLENNGLTLFGVIFLVCLLLATLVLQGQVRKKWYIGFAVVGMGLIGYLLVLLYTYLFVFDRWEAESMSSIDRYLGTYALAVLYLVLMIVCINASLKDKKGSKEDWRFSVLIAVFVMCMPWENLVNNLVPSRYMSKHLKEYEETMEVRKEIEKFKVEDLEVRTVMVVTSEGNSVYSRGMLYDLIPLIPAEYMVENPDTDHSEELLYKCLDESAYYVYFSDRLIRSGDKLDTVKSAFAEDIDNVGGKIYKYDEDLNCIVEFGE